jgi:hypothetical protein
MMKMAEGKFPLLLDGGGQPTALIHLAMAADYV